MSKAKEKAQNRYPTLAEELAFIDGYEEAEEDLSDISWIKEVSGVKEMKRAEEEALKAYPPRSIAANYDTINRRIAFEYGYLKAEKDLELTWEDISNIEECLSDVEEEITVGQHKGWGLKEMYQEALKRFKNLKHVK